MSESRPHLWMTRSDPRRFFLIPPGTQLPGGDVPIRNLQFANRDVLAEAVEGFEVDVGAAQAHLDGGWSRALESVRDSWRDLVGQPDLEGPPDLAAWLGVTPGEATLDPDKRREGRRSLLEKASALFGGGLDVDKAEATLDRLGAALARDAAKVGQGFERLGEELDARAPDIERAVEEAARALRPAEE